MASAKVKVYDPIAMPESKRVYLKDIVTYCDNMFDAVKDADALALVTEWKEFRLPNLEKVKKLMKGKIVVDGRDIFVPDEMRAAGFDYYAIGRK
jgi:UDPglucose 6-dehydrogenase